MFHDLILFILFNRYTSPLQKMQNYGFEMFANISDNGGTPNFSFKSHPQCHFAQHHIYIKVAGLNRTISIFLDGTLLSPPAKQTQFESYFGNSFIEPVANSNIEIVRRQTRRKNKKTITKQQEKTESTASKSWRKPEEPKKDEFKNPHMRNDGKLRKDASRLFQLAYGLNGHAKWHHNDVIMTAIKSYDCSIRAVLSLLYG